MPVAMELNSGVIALTYASGGLLWLIDTDQDSFYLSGTPFIVEKDQASPSPGFGIDLWLKRYFDVLLRQFLFP